MIALSTSTKTALVAVDINGKKDFASLSSNCKHSENLLSTINELLDKNQLNFADNNAFAVVIGPGSFTGERIGIALVKGFVCGGANAKVVPLTTFDLMAEEFIQKHKPSENFSCLIDGLSDFIFVCEYDKNGNKISSEKMIEKKDLEKNKVYVGLEEEDLCEIKITLTAKGLLSVANKKLTQNVEANPATLSPMYLRKSQAEVSLENKNKKN